MQDDVLPKLIGCGQETCAKICARYVTPNGRRFCKHDLADTFAPAKLEDTLEALVRLGLIRSWKAIGEVVFLDGDRPVTVKTKAAWRPTPYDNPRARVEAAMDAVREADPDQPEMRRRAWERFRRAALVWFWATTGGRGKSNAVARGHRPKWDRRKGSEGP